MTKDRLDLHLENYYFEMKRKDQLKAHLSLPSGLATLLFGAVAYFVKQVDSINTSFVKAVFILLIIATILCLVITIIFLILTYFGRKYKFFPTSKQVEDYWLELEEYYRTYPDAEGTKEGRYEAFLIERYCECNDRNSLNNDIKSAYFHKAIAWLIGALVCAALAIFPLHYNKVIAWYKIVKIGFASQEVKKHGPGKTTSKNTNSTANTSPSKGNP